MAAARAGPDRAREVATAPTLAAALDVLAGSPYRRGLDAAAGVPEAQRAVSGALLWQLRVLAGWQPPAGAAAVRLLCAGFEIANTRDHLRALSGVAPPRPYRLGSLSTAWSRLSATLSPAEVRAVLAASPWGDPGAETPAAVDTGMRLAAAARTTASLPQAAPWAAGRAALLVAREVFLLGRPLTATASGLAARVLGGAALTAGAFDDFRAALSPPAGWVLEGVEEPVGLWRAEAHWWGAVERDGLSMLREARFDVSPVVGSTAVLAADAWRVRAAVEAAACGGRAREVFDGLLD
jgi:hypothetical protein